MQTLKKCLEEIPRRPGTAHSYVIEWLVKKLEEP